MASGIREIVRRGVKRAAIHGGLELAWLAKRGRLMPAARGLGVIFTLHHVRPRRDDAFQPNFHLEVTPDFLDAALGQLHADGYRFLPLDAVPAALAQSGEAAPFAAFTLDDGYRNNAEHALPVFEKHGVPFTVFAAGGFIDRTHSLWWETAAAVIARQDRLVFDFGSGPQDLDTGSIAGKYHAFCRIGDFILRPGETDHIAVLNALAISCGVDPLEITDRLTLDEAGIRMIAAHPLAAIGAHTISHRALGLLDDDSARREMAASARRIEEITGARPAAIAFPYGDSLAATPRDFALAADLGFGVGVTTRPGTLTADGQPTALPRVSLNGFYQKRRYVSALASGIPFRLPGAGRG